MGSEIKVKFFSITHLGFFVVIFKAFYLFFSELKGNLACMKGTAEHPVCVSMAEEVCCRIFNSFSTFIIVVFCQVIGQFALQHTSLRKLGLTRGRAVIR